MRKTLLVFALLLCGSIGCGQDAFAKAESLYQQHNYEQAKPIFKSLLLEDAKKPILLRRLGDIESHAERYKTAFPYYKKLVELDESNADYHFLYGGALGLYAKNVSKFKALGLLDDIKKHLKRAAELDKNHIETRWALVQLYCELPGIVGGSLSKSRHYADELLQISPVDGYLAHGFIEEYDKEYKNAEQHYKNAITTGGSIHTYKKLAALYEKKMKTYNKAIATLQEAYNHHENQSLLDEISRIRSEYHLD